MNYNSLASTNEGWSLIDNFWDALPLLGKVGVYAAILTMLLIIIAPMIRDWRERKR